MTDQLLFRLVGAQAQDAREDFRLNTRPIVAPGLHAVTSLVVPPYLRKPSVAILALLHFLLENVKSFSTTGQILSKWKVSVLLLLEHVGYVFVA